MIMTRMMMMMMMMNTILITTFVMRMIMVCITSIVLHALICYVVARPISNSMAVCFQIEPAVPEWLNVLARKKASKTQELIETKPDTQVQIAPLRFVSHS